MSSVDFSFGDLLDESVERAGLSPAALTHAHLNSITRSLQILFMEMETKGANAEFRMETLDYEIDADALTIVLDSDTIDVTKASVIHNDVSHPMGRTTREDYQDLVFPTESGGIPTIFWLSKSTPSDPLVTVGTPGLFFWPQNGLSGDVSIRVTRIRQHAMPANFGSDLDTRRSWLPTLCAGLAAHIARKYNPADYPGLKMEYETALKSREQDEDHHPVTIGYRGFGFGRARRH